MRDGVVLLADHYAPSSTVRGTLLVRTPYGGRFPSSLIFARVYAAHGYHVVLQSVRGTSGSGGVFEPMVNEVADGADTVAWLRDQRWFTGTFGTLGVSYLGFTQWALLVDPPPELTAAVVTVGPHDFSASSWSTGSFTVNDFLGWSDAMARQEDDGDGPVQSGLRQLTARRRLARATAGLPLGAAGRALLGSGAPWYESWLEHPDTGDPFWRPYRFGAALDTVQVPVLLVSGWQDLFVDQTMAQYRRLADRGVEVGLTVGPWTHTEVPVRGLGVLTRESLDWFDTHLAGVGGPARRSPVRVFVTGGDGWRNLEHWPPATTPRSWWLHPGERLDVTDSAVGSAEFVYDPADPTPTVGGRLLAPGGGYRRDDALAARADVLVFTGAPLTEGLLVFGCPTVELEHSSDNPHVDVFVRVSEVDTRGRSHNVSDGYRRLAGASGPVRIELDPIAHRFTAGARIRLLIAGGCLPRFARNTGTGEPPVSAVGLRPATHTITFGESRLTLPIGDDRPG
ncbi:CocE/NonD family hydrolase [Mycobacterium sp. M1]|uniref:CocE/NonD family hydrolase n=2 Tax=Mycolicibacter acidiphilus TaxID=2835306 RepID=A0ABS5RMR2_9MYCO|nr:CocE/NonD family hydrolase [Mycolicibacter acidiphilus]